MEATTGQGKGKTMLRQRYIPAIVVGAVLCLCAGEALGGTIVVRSAFGRAHLIAHPLRPGVCIRPIYNRIVHVGPHHRRVAVTSPHHSRFVRIWPPCHKVAPTRHAPVRHVVVNPNPTVVVASPARVVGHTRITVWITNSNGSRTAVQLRRSGPGYLGPRGEWYPNMPTNKQLRVIYGF